MVVTGQVESQLMDIAGNGITSKSEIGSARSIDTNIRSFAREQVDAFGRLRVSNPHSLFNYININAINTDVWKTLVSGTGSVAKSGATTPQVSISTGGTASGARAVFQTGQYFRYQPGKSHRPMMTGTFSAGTANCIQRIGYFDDSNGVFFEKDGTSLYACIRSNITGSVVTTRVLQSSWNLNTMASLNTELTNIYSFDLQYLGVGIVRVGIVEGESIRYVHVFQNQNSVSVPYMSTPHLPLRYEIVNSGVAASSQTMTAICATVDSEGGRNERFELRAVDRDATALATPASPIWQPCISIRLKSANVREQVFLRGYSFWSNTADPFIVRILRNPTFTGGTAASWVSAGANSNVEYDITANPTTLTGGDILDNDYVLGNAKNSVSLESDAPLYASVGGVSDVIVLACKSINNAASVYGALKFKEIL